MSSAQSASVIVFAGYLLPLFFFSSKPFSLILSIEVLSTQSRQMIKRYGASVSPCNTPATMSKYSVSPSGERSFTLVFLQRIDITATVSFGRPYASRIYFIFPLYMESQALVKSTNSNVACRFFPSMPSRILWMVNICEVVDLFLRKPFWFFLRMFSILGSMWFRSRAASKIEQVLEVTPHKAAATVRPLTTHHGNYPSQTIQNYFSPCVI